MITEMSDKSPLVPELTINPGRISAVTMHVSCSSQDRVPDHARQENSLEIRLATTRHVGGKRGSLP